MKQTIRETYIPENVDSDVHLSKFSFCFRCLDKVKHRVDSHEVGQFYISLIVKVIASCKLQVLK